MSVHDDSSRHRQAWELIPWVVNGRASAEQRRVVEEHLVGCADCRDELALQSRIAQAMRGAEPAAPADHAPALRRLWQRIDAEADAESRPPPRRRGGIAARGLLAAVVIEALGIAALSAALFDRGRGHAPYVTLSAPAESAPHATIRAVLAPELSLAQLQDLLGESHLQIVGGPSEAGVYSLAPRSLREDLGTPAVLAQLRRHAGVRFAEPVDAAAHTAP
jgi:hypothetical protein